MMLRLPVLLLRTVKDPEGREMRIVGWTARAAPICEQALDVVDGTAIFTITTISKPSMFPEVSSGFTLLTTPI